MLTATYILVSLSVEQASIRMSLLAFQKYMQVQLRQQSRLSLAQLQYTGDWLNRLYQGGYWRKVEMYLVPAIRQAAPPSDGLLDGLLNELNGLNHVALESINLVQQRTGAAIDHSELQAGQLCAAIDAFCAALLQRLEKESANCSRWRARSSWAKRGLPSPTSSSPTMRVRRKRAVARRRCCLLCCPCRARLLAPLKPRVLPTPRRTLPCLPCSSLCVRRPERVACARPVRPFAPAARS